jgi:hypothetical protein
MKKTLLFLSIYAIALTLNAQSVDTCNDALSSTTIVADVTYTIGTINGDMPPAFCDGNGTNVTGGEWIKYVPTIDHGVTVSSDLVANGDKDTRVHVFTGNCGSLTCVAGDDDSGDFQGTNNRSYLAVVNFIATAGTTYYIVWDDRWGDSSDFDFILTEGDVPPPPPVSPITFTQQSISAPGVYDLGLVDMNGDFLDDVVSIGSDNKIYINYQINDGNTTPDFTFTEITTTTPDFHPTWSMAVADFDANGFNDLLYGAGSGVTFMKANSDGTGYTEFSGSENVFSQRSNFIDLNNDGHLDAFVCHDVAPSVYYINDGSGSLTFYQSSTPGAPFELGTYSSGGNYASIWIDYDNDRDLDMFMAKCGGTGDRPKNELYRNNGNGTFTQIANDPGINLWDNIQTWSSAWGDFDNDGDMDVYVGSSTGFDHKLMRNNGDGTFTDVTVGAGVSTADIGHENIAQDFDNDGNLDIYANGSILFGNGDLTFFVISTLTVPSGHGGAIGDLNNDGYLDLFKGSIYVNQAESGNNWLKIVTIGKSYDTANRSNRNGIGARVEINTASGTQIRDVRSGDGFKYTNSLNTHFGIGTETQINYVRIYWPSGVVDNIINPNINETLIVIEDTFTLSTADTFVDNLILYPNPTKGILNLNSIVELNDALYAIFDINGKRILNAKLDSESIDVSALSAGNYILRITSGNEVKNQKFIKL